jgi:hypothetical protein
MCSGKRCHRPCRSLHERKPDSQTKDDIGTEVRDKRSCGRSQTSLYNEVRPHSSLAYRTPEEFAAAWSASQETGTRDVVVGWHAHTGDGARSQRKLPPALRFAGPQSRIPGRRLPAAAEQPVTEAAGAPPYRVDAR